MNFDEALHYLLGLGHETVAIKLGLRNIQLLLESLRNPERGFPAVQIAGTNGKGSTASYLDSICHTAGIKTGLFTSPHLESITERIKIEGAKISCKDFAAYATRVRDAATQLLSNHEIAAVPTFFEQLTALALIAFQAAEIDLAILETGLGGRLDATTAVKAGVCGITQIAYDHEEYLGTAIENIAAEKAAIIQPGTVAVIAPQSPEVLTVILHRCHEVGVTPRLSNCQSTIKNVSEDGRFQVTFETPNYVYENVWLGLRGRHQIINAEVAIQLSEVLRERNFRIPSAAIVEGLGKASHPGRLELIPGNPTVLLDGAHNPAGAQTLRSYLLEFAGRPLTIVFGAMRDKRVDEIAESLFPIADQVILTNVQNPRNASVEMLVPIAEKAAKGRICVAETSREAIKMAQDRTEAGGLICITGSLYLIGEVRRQILNRPIGMCA